MSATPRRISSLTGVQTIARLFAGPGMVLAGLNHFRAPRTYRAIVPGYLPAPSALVAVSGAAEVVGGLAAMHPATRPLARPWLAAPPGAAWPAPVGRLEPPHLSPRLPGAALGARLAMKPALVGLVLVAPGRR